ncbi:ADP-ribosylglycohydrolase family protein [Oceanimonas pelagia]|uniref:ADP-ribosylglycohydrolase family protein n=1 Tax=Oceanimonas pelagia TaxID=3028314 RepID=A0AA50KN15_9GAMM|nr:ADP-ribosylglycohydrolase family protein [Oceanimonas pelagia]WMC10098.1 ADP-ribosylglycohydrolase family protein [Oceanimonas pelagia]
MNQITPPALFDCLQHRHSGQQLRVIQRRLDGLAPMVWALDGQGQLHELPMGPELAETWHRHNPPVLDNQDPARMLGCLLAGAAGDALGAPVEFMSWPEIERTFGPGGIRTMAEAYGRRGAITDDTQMMLFTAEGLLRGQVRARARGLCSPYSVIHNALLRWLLTQGQSPAANVSRNGWLIKKRRLWARRAPGNTCLSALAASTHFGEWAQNNSKGCGGVMRVAPCAFFDNAFELASDSARLTHGHPSGYLAAGLFADILHRLWQHGCSLEAACTGALAAHDKQPGMEETRQLIEHVLKCYRRDEKPTPRSIEQLGRGWVAEEALAIGLWCSLCAGSLEEGIILAVNHSGDSDSTGLIAGNLLGLIHGPQAIPAHWLKELELKDVITQVAADISFVPLRFWDYDEDDTDVSDWIWQRYPGG